VQQHHLLRVERAVQFQQRFVPAEKAHVGRLGKAGSSGPASADRELLTRSFSFGRSSFAGNSRIGNDSKTTGTGQSSSGTGT
jgi:hypothetical protein